MKIKAFLHSMLFCKSYCSRMLEGKKPLITMPCAATFNIAPFTFNLRKTVLLFAFSFFIIHTTYASTHVEYTQADSIKVVSLLKVAKTARADENRIIYFAKQFLGVPYVGHTLENGNSEHLIVNLHELDCTTFVETVFALALCDKNDTRTFKDYCDNLTLIRYRNGKMTDYTSRLHYFTWWVTDNEKLGLIRDIAPSIKEDAKSPFTGVQTINVNYMSKHPSLYKQLKNHPDFTPVIKMYEDLSNGKRYRYIPKKNLSWKQSSSLGIVHSGDIVAMLTDSDGLDTRHIGIAYWQDGQLHLLHASSLYHKVIISKETFYEYEAKQTKHTGIRVFRME